MDSRPVPDRSREGAHQNRAPAGIVVTLSATPNQICQRKSILLAKRSEPLFVEAVPRYAEALPDDSPVCAIRALRWR